MLRPVSLIIYGIPASLRLAGFAGLFQAVTLNLVSVRLIVLVLKRLIPIRAVARIVTTIDRVVKVGTFVLQHTFFQDFLSFWVKVAKTGALRRVHAGHLALLTANHKTLR
jgi:ribosomal protein L28